RVGSARRAPPHAREHPVVSSERGAGRAVRLVQGAPLMRDVAVVSFAHRLEPRADRDEVEMLAPTIAEALAAAKVERRDVGITVSASCDYLGGRPFSFVMALDAVGAWPPIRESHVEMDGAWALYEAWVALQHGDIDVALVYAFGRPSQGDLRDVLVTQLDPYVV